MNNSRFTAPDLEIRSGQIARSSDRKIEGTAIVFGSKSENIGGFREIILPEAVNRSLKGTKPIFAFVEHDTGKVLGSTKTGRLSLRADTAGLHVVIEPTQTSYAQDLITNIAEGELTGMSFGFRALDVDWQDGPDVPVRIVRDMELYEVSVVAFPAYQDTSVAVRSLQDRKPSKLAYYKALNIQKTI